MPTNPTTTTTVSAAGPSLLRSLLYATATLALVAVSVGSLYG